MCVYATQEYALVQHIPMRKCRYLQTAGGSAFNSPLKAFHNACSKHAQTFSFLRFHALKFKDSILKQNDRGLVLVKLPCNFPFCIYTFYIHYTTTFVSSASLFNICINLNVDIKDILCISCWGCIFASLHRGIAWKRLCYCCVQEGWGYSTVAATAP